jgi:serine/threonine-protein kinase
MWTLDGRHLLFVRSGGFGIGYDILIMDMENQNQVSEFIVTKYSERNPRLSPDNRWVAYQSTESGRPEVYVTKFPEKGGRWLVSSNGGTEPIWSPDGEKIYYRWRNNLMVVDILTENGFKAGKPKILFTGKFRRDPYGVYYDIHPDGDRFVMVKEAEIDTTENRIRIIQNFDKEVERKFASAM